MAQDSMGPPLSPREPRRSGRRSAPSVNSSNSQSKSPVSDIGHNANPISNGSSQRPPLSTHHSNSSQRGKRMKQEDLDEPPASATAASTTSTSSSAAANGRTNKRKGKEKDKDKEKDHIFKEKHNGSGDGDPDEAPPDDIEEPDQNGEQPPAPDEDAETGDAGDNDGQKAEDEEDQGVTRCICGSAVRQGEDDPEAGEFMVQCETCKVWQHGPCMGYESEDQLHDDDYYCEQCRPELHTDVVKSKRKRKPRQSSAASAAHPSASRVSRSHSPTQLLNSNKLAHFQPSKRRLTMNSRDAAFDENLKEVLEATAVEAGVAEPSAFLTNGNGHAEEEDVEMAGNGPSNRKKRRRSDDEQPVKKRTRSMSTTSDVPIHGIRDDTPTQGNSGSGRGSVAAAPVPAAKNPRNKRGGKKGVNARQAAAAAASAGLDDLETIVAPAPKGKGARAKGGAGKRNANAANATGETVRGSKAANGVNGYLHPGPGDSSAGPAANSREARAYRSSHAYIVSQQTLYTSWNLPDYLQHLEGSLPTEAPIPLEIRVGPTASGSAAGTRAGSIGRGESMERSTERGVKVKWPSKRMSVGDMNKRVRALVDWVGREQLSAQDRDRRKSALEKAIHAESSASSRKHPRDSNAMDVDLLQEGDGQSDTLRSLLSTSTALDKTSAETMKKMEELMEELLDFQDKFGPGAKARDKELRKQQAASGS